MIEGSNENCNECPCHTTPRCLGHGSLNDAGGHPAGASHALGFVSGKVALCGGVAYAPGQPIPGPVPASVSLVRNQMTSDSVLVRFSKMNYGGTCLLTAPAGRYEVVVAIPDYPVRRVTIKSGVHKVASFGVIVCPS